jgi:hypothetical protein
MALHPLGTDLWRNHFRELSEPGLTRFSDFQDAAAHAPTNPILLILKSGKSCF